MRNSRTHPARLAAACAALASALHGAAGGELEFTPRRVVDPVPPIVRPAALPAAKSGGVVTGNELVLGVVAGGKARAYPHNQLTGPSREIVNEHPMRQS